MDAMHLRVSHEAVEWPKSKPHVGVNEEYENLHSPRGQYASNVRELENDHQGNAHEQWKQEYLKVMMPNARGYIHLFFAVMKGMLRPKPAGSVLQSVKPIVKEVIKQETQENERDGVPPMPAVRQSYVNPARACYA